MSDKHSSICSVPQGPRKNPVVPTGSAGTGGQRWPSPGTPGPSLRPHRYQDGEGDSETVLRIRIYLEMPAQRRAQLDKGGDWPWPELIGQWQMDQWNKETAEAAGCTA